MPSFSGESFFDPIKISFSHHPNPDPDRDPKSGRYHYGIDPNATAELAALPDMRVSPYGIVFVDRDLRILETNDRAKYYLAAEQGMAGRSGKLHLHRAGAMRRLHEAVGRQLAPSGPREAALVGVPDGEGRIRYAVRVGAATERAGVQSALLVVAELIDGNDVSRSELSSVFGLSDREAELAECFSKGMRLERIAPIMHVSVATARMHLRRVFVKTGCCTQAELARMIALVPANSRNDRPGAVPLGLLQRRPVAEADLHAERGPMQAGRPSALDGAATV
jgi:DNA-binding CsgD family transcriptional regulator